MQLPDSWQQVPVIEANKPSSILEAIRNNNKNEFLTLVVFPTVSREVGEERLESWSNEMAQAFGVGKKDIKSIRIYSSANGNWYNIVSNYNSDKINSFFTVANGYSYCITFLTDKPKDKKFDSEAEAIVGSISFHKPLIIQSIKDYFAKAAMDETTSIVIPQNFRFTKKPNSKTTPPFAYSLYNSLLSANNIDYVLVTDSMHDQLFCLNVKLNTPIADETTISFLCKVVGNQFKKDALKYEEIVAAPWDKAPEKVFLHKFRLLKENAATTHYIFFCNVNEVQHMIKIQTATVLENEFESSFFDLILKNI